jgi:hypothetical protein
VCPCVLTIENEATLPFSSIVRSIPTYPVIRSNHKRLYTLIINKVSTILVGLTLFGSVFSQTGTFNSLTVTGRTGLGMSITNDNRMLWVSRPSTDVGDWESNYLCLQRRIF